MNRIFKQILIFAIMCVLMINSISVAAVVSDNDGSAFITKSEYDSLKNNFQSQLDGYNTSIDSKIDSAIASYLAGIKTELTSQLTNIYDMLGGSNIKFGKIANFTTPTEPITGWSYYFIDCWRAGYCALYPGAGYTAIKNPDNSAWWTAGSSTSPGRGDGQRGCFITYDLDNSKKYLSKYKYAILEAIYVGGWYRVVEHVNSVQSYPFGTSPTVLGESCSVGTNSLVDSYNAYYRVYHVTNSDGECNIDLSTWTSAWDMDTAADKYFIDNEEYNMPSEYRIADQDRIITGDTATTTAVSGTATRGGTCNGSISFTDIRVYGWKYDNYGTSSLQTYSNLVPGFYKEKKYENKLYGGVQFFTTGNKDGKVKISNLKFTRHIKSGGSISTDGDVYFAINSSAFTNSTNLSGDVKLTKKPDTVVLDVEAQNLYKVPAKQEVSIEFDAKANTTYFIKCQYQKAATRSNFNWCGIDDGAKISITVEQ